MIGISNRALNLNESATLKMARIAGELKAQGKDIISLSLGEPDFDTPMKIKNAAKKAIDDNHSHYTPVPGVLELRQAISEKFKRDNQIDYKAEQIVVSTGAKQAIMNVLLATLNEGEEILIPAPYWVSYVDMANFVGAKVKTIDTDITTDFKLSPAVLEENLSDKTKVFLFSNPCNPSGSLYTTEEISALSKVFEKYDCYIISDEIYEHINFLDERPKSLGSFEKLKHKVITINGMSKGYAMTGWRLGFMGAPLDVAKACSKIQGQFTSGANSIAQIASIEGLNNCFEEADQMKSAFLKRRNLVQQELKKINNLEVNLPQGAFYLFPDVSKFYGKKFEENTINNSEDLCSFLLSEALVATTPGDAFGCPKNIRLSYAASEDILLEACKRIKVALDKLS